MLGDNKDMEMPARKDKINSNVKDIMTKQRDKRLQNILKDVSKNNAKIPLGGHEGVE